MSTSDDWLRFQCKYVLRVSELIQNALEAERRRLGRCLLESNGSVVSASPHDKHMTTPDQKASRDKANAFANESASRGHTIFSPFRRNGTSESQTSSIETVQPGAAPSQNDKEFENASKSNTYIAASSIPLICPCNCTNSDFACCFSKIVEMTSTTIPSNSTDWKPPLPGLICDTYSGLWLAPKGAGYRKGRGGSQVPPSSVETTLRTFNPRKARISLDEGEVDFRLR